jgi:hypothetical protein
MKKLGLWVYLLASLSTQVSKADSLISFGKPASAVSGLQNYLDRLTDGIMPGHPAWTPGGFFGNQNWAGAPRAVVFQVDLQDSFLISGLRIWGNNTISTYYTIGTFSLDFSNDGLMFNRVVDHKSDYWLGAQDLAHTPPELLLLTSPNATLPTRYVRFTVDSNALDDNPPPVSIPDSTLGSGIAEFELFGTVVPEPTAASLLGLGLLFLGRKVVFGSKSN